MHGLLISCDQCSGEKPKCQSCIKRNELCVYDLERGKARYDALAAKHKNLEKSDADLQELISALQNRPDREAADILQRLRSETDHLAVLNHVRDGELLLQTSVNLAGDIRQNNLSIPLKAGHAQIPECSSCGASGQDCRCDGKAPETRRNFPLGSVVWNSTRDSLQSPDNEVTPTFSMPSQQDRSALGQYGKQTQALKRKYADREQLYREYNSLYSRITTGSEAEATAIFRSLRNGEDPSTIMRTLHNRDMQNALLLNSRTTLQQAILNSLVQSTASLQKIIDYFEFSGRGPSANLPPMHGVFEPLRNRTIDLVMLQQALQKKYQSSLQGPKKGTKALNLVPNTSPENLDDEQAVPPFLVPAWPWTRLTTDDVFVSRLISLFLTYYNVYLKCVEEQSFLHAICSGQLDSEYCSPFLVNAICAYAAVRSPGKCWRYCPAPILWL